MGVIGPQLIKGTVPVGVGTFFRFVSIIAETVTLAPAATVTAEGLIERAGLGYLTVTLYGCELELP